VSRPVDPHELRRAAGVATPSGFLAFPDLLPIASGRFHPVACRAVTLRLSRAQGLGLWLLPGGIDAVPDHSSRRRKGIRSFAHAALHRALLRGQTDRHSPCCGRGRYKPAAVKGRRARHRRATRKAGLPRTYIRCLQWPNAVYPLRRASGCRS
jgi:hypothetical protein